MQHMYPTDPGMRSWMRQVPTLARPSSRRRGSWRTPALSCVIRPIPSACCRPMKDRNMPIPAVCDRNELCCRFRMAQSRNDGRCCCSMISQQEGVTESKQRKLDIDCREGGGMAWRCVHLEQTSNGWPHTLRHACRVPAAVAYMMWRGMSSTSRPRTPDTEIARKMKPSTNTAASACL